MFTAPQKLLVVSDGNVMILKEQNFVKKEGQFKYQYIDSVTKMNEYLTLTEKELQHYLSNNIFKEI